MKRLAGQIGRLTRPAGGPWSPAKLPSLKLWLEADYGVLDGSGNPAANGVAVATWTDRSGNNDLTQATAARRPTYVASASNGKPALRFVHANDQYLTTPYTSTNSSTVFAAIQLTTGGGYGNAALSWWSGALEDWQQFLLMTDAPGLNQPLRFYARNDFYSPTITGDWGLAVAKLDYTAPGSKKGWWNEVAGDVSTGQVAGGAGRTLAVGERNQGNNQSWSGYIASIVVCGEALADSDRTTCQSYLVDKYGIVLT